MSFVAECEQCGVIERGEFEAVGDAAEDHEQFHDVKISRVVTDGGTQTAATEHPTKVCIDLFSGLGGFSAAFADADEWTVYTVDLVEDFGADIHADVLDLRPSNLLHLIDDADVLVVLAGHPCTYFTPIRRITKGGDAAWTDGQPSTPDCRDHVAMVHHTIGLIKGLTPDYWFLENPKGTLQNVIGRPETTVWYCQYGHDSAKPTWLWGNHPPTFTPRRCNYGNDDCHHAKTTSYKDHGGSDNRQGILKTDDSAERAKVPYELSESIRDAVDDAIAGAVETRQPTLFDSATEDGQASLQEVGR